MPTYFKGLDSVLDPIFTEDELRAGERVVWCRLDKDVTPNTVHFAVGETSWPHEFTIANRD